MDIRGVYVCELWISNANCRTENTYNVCEFKSKYGHYYHFLCETERMENTHRTKMVIHLFLYFFRLPILMMFKMKTIPFDAFSPSYSTNKISHYGFQYRQSISYEFVWNKLKSDKFQHLLNDENGDSDDVCTIRDRLMFNVALLDLDSFIFWVNECVFRHKVNSLVFVNYSLGIRIHWKINAFYRNDGNQNTNTNIGTGK